MILALVKIVYPLVWIATKLTNLISSKNQSEVTRDEIMALASLSHKDGNLFDEESDYLSNLLNLRNVTTKAVLTPRTVVHMLPLKATVAEALAKASATVAFKGSICTTVLGVKTAFVVTFLKFKRLER